MTSIDLFSPATGAWFAESFEKPTPAQAAAWPLIAERRNVLVVAPTGSGKTLAAFLSAIDDLTNRPGDGTRVLYISPLKALAADIERNLRSPLRGIRNAARRLGLAEPDISSWVRTGDTPQDQRRKFAREKPDILITTPESLFLMLTSSASGALETVETVIVDEIHSVAGTKRGSHLALSLERLDEILPRPAQRIGLSATVRPLEEVADFLGGTHQVEIVAPPFHKEFDLKVVVPVEDMSDLDASIDPHQPFADEEPRKKTIWPAIEARLLEMIRAHNSTIVFCNSRRLAERVCARINEMAEAEIARAHHGSVSKEERKKIEEDLKEGRLKAVVATSSLELGIDMGSVDLVLQVEAPNSVSSGLQRIGRAGHQVGAVSRGIIFPKFRGDLLESAVVIELMKQGAIEPVRYPRNPLDVLSQQVVAMAAMDEWLEDDLLRVVRRAAPFRDLPESAFSSVLDMLSGRYPSDEFAELRPRLNWDRAAGRISGRQGAKHLAVTSGGTIPDRGLFGVFLAGTETVRVGELDEEMVYESRVGDVFVLGSTSWRIEDITIDRVLVTPAPGEVARLPFWKGDQPGRPVELGRALGRFVREIDEAGTVEARIRLREAGLDEWAAENLIAFLEEQKLAAGHLPDDRTIVVERFRDELGDWRLCIHSPFGARIHAPWALAIRRRFAERLDVEVQSIHTDDGIVLRLPDGFDGPVADAVFFDPEEIEALVTEAALGSALFAARFRECAARSLLLPRRQPGKRTPLWQQRQRSAGLLEVAAKYGSFPVILETMRECLQDVFDMPSLVELMTFIRSRKVRVVEVETPVASPFAASLLFGYIGAFLYETDAPLAERRAQALSLDTALLSELLGRAELRELLEADVVDEVELSLQRLTPQTRIRDADDLHDALRQLGDLSAAEMIQRGANPDWAPLLESTRRVVRLRVAAEERWIAAEDAARYRDGLGSPLPPGLPSSFLEPATDPMSDLVGRYARTHGPFVPGDVSGRLGIPPAVVSVHLGHLESEGRVVRGEFRPGGSGTEWCHSDVLRILRRKSLARLRNQIEAVPPDALARFLPSWQGVGVLRGGYDSLLRCIEQLQGAQVPASALESLILPSRIPGYFPAMLDELCAAGEVTWRGFGPIGADDGWVSLYLTEDAVLLDPPRTPPEDGLALNVLDALRNRGASFFREISSSVEGAEDAVLLSAIWDLAWSGLVTNDTLQPLRALSRARRSGSPSRKRTFRRPPLPSRAGPASGAGRWSAAPENFGDVTRRLHALAEQMLDRYGVVTRGSVVAEGPPGGFAAVYQVLKQMEESGRCRRGYFVEGLGAAQFAMPGAVDRLRSVENEAGKQSAIVLAATDPANPFGASIPWPDSEGHRPGRKAGAVVVLVSGRLVIYVEKGGRSLLTWSEEPELLQPAVDSLALAVREGSLGRLAVERADGEEVSEGPLSNALTSAGFRHTPKGLRLRA